MEKENYQTYYELIVTLIKEHKKYQGLEDILDDIAKDVYEHAKVVLGTVTNEDVVITYLNKVISTCLITVPKKLNYTIQSRRNRSSVILTIPRSEEREAVEDNSDDNFEQELMDLAKEPEQTLESTDEPKIIDNRGTIEVNNKIEEVVEKVVVQEEVHETDVYDVEIKDHSSEIDELFNISTVKETEEIEDTAIVDDLVENSTTDTTETEFVTETVELNEVVEQTNSHADSDVDITLVDKMINGISTEKTVETDENIQSENIAELDDITELLEPETDEDLSDIEDFESSENDNFSEIIDSADEIEDLYSPINNDNIDNDVITENPLDNEEEQVEVLEEDAPKVVKDEIVENDNVEELEISEEIVETLDIQEEVSKDLELVDDADELEESTENTIEEALEESVEEDSLISEDEATEELEISEVVNETLELQEEASEDLELVDDANKLEENFELVDGAEELLLEETEEVSLLNDGDNDREEAVEVNNETQDTSEISSMYDCFSYEPESSIDDRYDEAEIVQELIELDSKHPEYKVLQIFEYKYKKSMSVDEIAAELDIDSNKIIEIINEIIDIVKD